MRQVLSRASVDRIFGYEKALFDFDSKHITRPGNAVLPIGPQSDIVGPDLATVAARIIDFDREER